MPTVAELKAELEGKGIKFKHDAKKAELEALLKAAEGKAVEAEEPKPATQMIVNTALLNIRTAPEMVPETVARIAEEGEAVLVREIENEWACLDDGTYCKAEFLRDFEG